MVKNRNLDSDSTNDTEVTQSQDRSERVEAQDDGEERMYDGQIAGNPEVNETQVRRAGRFIDDEAAARELREGNVLDASSVQQGQTSAQREQRESR